jgi:hypothetical protein
MARADLPVAVEFKIGFRSHRPPQMRFPEAVLIDMLHRGPFLEHDHVVIFRKLCRQHRIRDG